MLAVAACSAPPPADNNLDALDAELAGNTVLANSRDPALMSALADQIMVDPALTDQANNDSLRPPARPYSGAMPPDTAPAPGSADAAPPPGLKMAPAASSACPDCQAKREAVTLAGLAQRQRAGGIGGCVADLRYSTLWATRLPAELDLYPGARVTEAAGVDKPACKARVVSFASAASLRMVLDWYFTRAANAGYSASHETDGDTHVLGGTRADGGAFIAYLTARADGGTDVDLIANTGR